MSTKLRVGVVGSLCVLGAVSVAAAQDTLASARQLYGSAAYDEALSILDRLKASPPPEPGAAMVVDQYRAFCLMALGRQADADRAIEAVVVADPFFLPSETDFAPRVLAAFRDARRRLLPGVAQQRYIEAKGAYDRKDYAAALAGFDTTMKMIEAPDLAEAAAQPPLSDLRTLVTGFRELARAAAAPPPAPPAPKTEPAAAPETKPSPATPPAPPPKPFYTFDDKDVVPPTVIAQRVPRWPTNLPGSFMPKGRRGVIEVVIDREGNVEAAVMRQSISAAYDGLLISEARAWRYKPATKDGAPVKFMKMIQITVE